MSLLDLLTEEELKYTDKLTGIEKSFITDYEYYGCDSCWVKHLRPTFFLFYALKPSSIYCTRQAYFKRKFWTFDKCTHKPQHTHAQNK